MQKEIEIYIRHSSAGTFLNFHIPSQLKKKFISAIQKGSLSEGDALMAVELSVLPEWITDKEVQEKLSSMNESIHLRIPVTSLNVNFLEE